MYAGSPRQAQVRLSHLASISLLGREEVMAPPKRSLVTDMAEWLSVLWDEGKDVLDGEGSGRDWFAWLCAGAGGRECAGAGAG